MISRNAPADDLDDDLPGRVDLARAPYNVHARAASAITCAASKLFLIKQQLAATLAKLRSLSASREARSDFGETQIS
eukprot:SAG11_NODE_2856_length_2901_cov_3.495717_1_plen_77_part_00